MISVCMATYNGEAYLEAQLHSILKQLNDEDEIVISDDGSIDNTIEIIKKIDDHRIRLIHNDNHGVVHNFENSLMNAKGDYIFLSDQDDEWLPNKVKDCLRYLNKYDCVVSDCYICNSDGVTINDSFWKLNNTRKSKYYNLLIKSGYIGCCMAFKAEILSSVLPFPGDIPLHDMWIGNVAAFKYHLAWSPKKLMKYRRHGNNASCAAEKSNSSFSEKIGFRWHIAKNLFERYRKF